MRSSYPVFYIGEGARNERGFIMERKEINATTRTALGKGATKRLRKEARLPAVIYNGKGESTLIDFDELEFTKLFKVITDSTIINVKVDGKTDNLSFIKAVQYDIIKDRIGHVDFYEVEAGQVLRTKIQIRLTGSPEGVRLGGVLETGVTEIEVECLPKNLPERFIIDVSTLELNHSLHVRDIKVVAGVKILTDADLPVATLRYTKPEVEAEATAAAPEAAPAKDAAKAAPAKAAT